MKVKKEKMLRLILLLMLLIILLLLSAKTRDFINQKRIIKNKLEKQQLLNSNLKNQYFNELQKRPEGSAAAAFSKRKREEILTQLKRLNLSLIDFNSTETEVNLNLNGDFHSILKFIKYLELEFKDNKISEFKIKNNQNKLFFFLKLKNELIKHE